MVYELVKKEYEEVKQYNLDSKRKKDLIIAHVETRLFNDSEKRKNIEKQFERGLICALEYVTAIQDVFDDISFDVNQTLQRILEEVK